MGPDGKRASRGVGMAYSVIVWLVDPGKHPQQDEEEEWAQAGRDQAPGAHTGSTVGYSLPRMRYGVYESQEEAEGALSEISDSLQQNRPLRITSQASRTRRRPPHAASPPRERRRARAPPLGDLGQPAAEQAPPDHLPGQPAVAPPRKPRPLRRLRRGPAAEGPVTLRYEEGGRGRLWPRPPSVVRARSAILRANRGEGGSVSSETLRRSLDESVRNTPTVYHIPVCPFSQRLEILLSLKGLGDSVAFHVVDITRPRAGWLLEKTRGTTALPVLETAGGGSIKAGRGGVGWRRAGRHAH